MSAKSRYGAAPAADREEAIESSHERRIDELVQASLVDLFDEQAETCADRVALELDRGRITYAELNTGANQVAHLLHELGIGRGDVVTVLMDRSQEVYTAILGALKAGAAYSPIDPAYPRERVRTIFEQCRPRAVLTKSSFLHQVEVAPDTFIILLDELRQFQKAKKRSGTVFDVHDVRRRFVANLPSMCRAGDLAYVMFTSGSTGAPKGVMIEHGSVVNLIDWARHTFQVTPDSRLSQNYNIAFDPSVQEIFTAFLSGATLVPVSDEIRINPPRFLRWMREKAISHWDTVPSLWYRIVDHLKACPEGDRLALPRLEALLLGGETIHGDKLRTWIERVEQDHRIYNMYGPTEATVTSTCFQLAAGEVGRIVPIGKPLWNVQIQIMDERLAPCPPEVEGEICISGAGLARGYLNAPELTAAAFPEGRTPGQRLYRTGDFGRRLADGNIEFLGRRDDQVKVRGHRVELTEIEAALRECSAIDDVTVTVSEDEEVAHRKIVAFYISEASVTPDELRAHVQARLPVYATPHHFVRVGTFPLTPSDKIDKRALLQLPREADEVRFASSRPPSTATEVRLVSIWKETLGVDHVGTDDDFFSLGGDSLLTVMVQHRCEQEGIRLRSIDVLRHPTIGDLARYIDGAALSEMHDHEQDRAPVTLSPQQRRLLPDDAEEVIPLLGLQKKMLRESAQHGGTIYIPQAILHCQGRVDLAALEKAVNVLVSRHEALRTVFRTDLGAEPVQVVLSDVRYRIAHEDLSAITPDSAVGGEPPADGGADRRVDGGTEGEFSPRKHRLQRPGDAPGAQDPALRARDEHVRREADAALTRGFDLAQWPPFNLTVYTKSDAEFDIVWTIHHIVMDGWSTSLFYKELSLVYSSIVTKRFRPLPQLHRGFGDVVRDALGRAGRLTRAFWEAHLAGAAHPRLPADFAAGGDGPWRIKSFAFALDEAATQRVRGFARAQAVTLNTACVAAYYLFLGQITGQDDVTAGLVTSGRGGGRAGTESVIGSFINVVPLRVKLATLATFGDVVRFVQKMLSEVVAAESLDLTDVATLARSGEAPEPLQTMFVSETYPSPEELGIVPFETFRVSGVTARESNGCPLTVVCSEEESCLAFCFEYAVDLFSAATIRDWSLRFLAILRETW